MSYILLVLYVLTIFSPSTVALCSPRGRANEQAEFNTSGEAQKVLCSENSEKGLTSEVPEQLKTVIKNTTIFNETSSQILVKKSVKKTKSLVAGKKEAEEVNTDDDGFYKDTLLVIFLVIANILIVLGIFHAFTRKTKRSNKGKVGEKENAPKLAKAASNTSSNVKQAAQVKKSVTKNKTVAAGNEMSSPESPVSSGESPSPPESDRVFSYSDSLKLLVPIPVFDHEQIRHKVRKSDPDCPCDLCKARTQLWETHESETYRGSEEER